MLHDADYEQWPEEHPKRIVAWLRERGEDEIAYAISAHYSRWGVPHRSQLDKSLLGGDELTGFVVASCLVRPDGVTTLTPKSVRKKLKNKAFAAKVDRSEIARGVELLESISPSTPSSSSMRSSSTPTSWALAPDRSPDRSNFARAAA